MNSAETNKNLNKRKRLYKKKTAWHSDEEALLITLWGDHIDEFRGCRRNSHIFEEITLAMSSSGYSFTSDERRIKIHNLTNKYRDEKRKIGPSGGSPSSWGFFERVHSILGGFKSNSIEMIMDESIETPQSLNTSYSVEEFEVEVLEEYSMDSTTQESVGTPTETPKKKTKLNFQNEVLKRMDKSTEIIQKQLEKHEESEAKILKIQEEMLAIEKERNEILKAFLNK